MKGSAKAMPTIRPSRRCAYSSPENSLELIEDHAPVDFLIFGEALVVGEERLPRLLPERRQHAHQRTPVHDGKPGVVEACNAAEHDHGEHEAGERQQPIGDGTAVVLDAFGCDGAAPGGPEGRSVHARVGRSRRKRLRAR